MAKGPREIPGVICWWRRSLRQQNGTNYIAITQLAVDGGTDWGDPWAGSVEYFDDRDDWFFPYTHRFTRRQPPRDALLDSLGIVRAPSHEVFLDVLNVTWPGRGWFRLSKNGIHHPDDYKESTYDWR